VPWKWALPLKWVPQVPRIWEREIAEPKPTEADHDQTLVLTGLATFRLVGHSEGDRGTRFVRRSRGRKAALPETVPNKVFSLKVSQFRGSLHGGQIGPMERQFCWEVLYNHYVLHVGA
jgi:hypothetical protein